MKRNTKQRILSASECVLKQFSEILNVSLSGWIIVSTVNNQQDISIPRQQIECYVGEKPVNISGKYKMLKINDFVIGFRGCNCTQNEAICILVLYEAGLFGSRTLRKLKEKTNNPFLTDEYLEKIISKNVTCVPI